MVCNSPNAKKYFIFYCIIEKINRNKFYFRIQNTTAAYSSDALKHKEAPIVENDVILSDEEVREREKLSHLVSLPKEVSVIFVYSTNREMKSRNFTEMPRSYQRSSRGACENKTRSHLHSTKECHAKWNQ